MTISPDAGFLFRHPAHFIALGLGSGLMPKAPGTFGTLVALPLFLGLMIQLPMVWQFALIALLFLIGIPACQKTGDALGVSDHGSIVWDEIVAMLLVLACTPQHPYWWGVAFVLFRIFDIWKPFPIRRVEAILHNGLGVMLDDLLAAAYTIALLKGASWMTTVF
jgi:phosphatidylglycerophosphatase A